MSPKPKMPEIFEAREAFITAAMLAYWQHIRERVESLAAFSKEQPR